METTFAVDDHFEGKAQAVRNTYDRLLKATRRFGPVHEEAKKTSIHLVNATAFAGVATRKEHMILTIKSDRAIESPRIHRSEQTSQRRYHHEVKLGAPDQIDDELIAWLHAAYDLSA